MTLHEIIREKGLKKEYVIKKSGIPRNRFYCDQDKLYKFSTSELETLATVIGIDSNVLTELALKKK